VTLKETSGRIKIIGLSHVVEVNFPSLPDGLITRPTLFWKYQSASSGKFPCKVGYQTGGMNWNAEYVGLLNADETKLDLSGWSSITNNSGKTYTDAKLKLVAGDIHRARTPMAPRGKRFDMATAEVAGMGFEEKSFFEYHLYTLPRSATIANKEIKQISLFEPAQADVTKAFLYRPERNPKKVEVVLRFTNSEAAGLGMALPAGRVRLFKGDDDGDIVAEERLMNQNRISQRVEEKEFEIEIRNRKDQAVTVEVEKKLYGDWEILQASHEYTKKDAFTVKFSLPVGADEKVTLAYKVRYNYR
jgi:hypothetical protein